jgi:hypothetical protein
MADFLSPAFDHVEAEWMENLIKTAGSTDPRAPEIITRLTSGIKAIRTVRAQVEAIVADGVAAEAEITRHAQLSRMSPHMRSVVGV